jgi:hypothetical protein
MKKIFIPLLSSFMFLLAACLPAAPTEPVRTGNPGDILYQESFTDNTSGWDRVINDGGIMDYDSGGYRILVRQPNMNYWSTPEMNFGDVRVEVDVTKLNGPDENRMGLMCRYQNGNYYFFVISNDGYYGIGKFINGQASLMGDSDMSPIPIVQLEPLNHLRVDCVGDMLRFYVNYTEIANVQDGELQTGDVGVMAGSFSEPGVDVLFQNFVVMQP